MALQMESATQIIEINEMLFKKITKKMKLFDLSVDSVAIVRSKILIGKNSMQKVLLCKIKKFQQGLGGFGYLRLRRSKVIPQPNGFGP